MPTTNENGCCYQEWGDLLCGEAQNPTILSIRSNDTFNSTAVSSLSH